VLLQRLSWMLQALLQQLCLQQAAQTQPSLLQQYQCNLQQQQ
jgi:hypothetical protein